MIFDGVLATFAYLSLALNLWQWLAARRFPLHRRIGARSAEDVSPVTPAVTLLKPIKGCDEHTKACLRSWFVQEYAGEMQILLAVPADDDPACAIINQLLEEFPDRDAELVVCRERLGANAKISQLVQVEPRVKHDVTLVSDADVRVPPDFLVNVVAPLRDEQVGVVNCFYRFANPTTLAMQWEAIAVNADFWSSVLQSVSFRKLDFALGAVMVTRRKQLAEIGGFKALVNCLADDYQLGQRVARQGYRIELCPVVVECWSGTMGWGEVWRHQLRWARTIRACQGLPYFFSVLANATLWPLIWLAAFPSVKVAVAAGICLLVRLGTATELQTRLTQQRVSLLRLWLVWVKDLLQFALWLGAFTGNQVEWRGERYRLRRNGILERK